MKSQHSALRVQREWQLFACHHHNIAFNSSTVINLYVATINTAIANCDTVFISCGRWLRGGGGGDSA